MKAGLTLALLVSSLCFAAEPPARFREHVVATGLKGGYQVTAVDLDRDGDRDLIALASGMEELVWFENPGWERRVLSRGRRRMINLAACGAGEGGRLVIVLAERFSSNAANSEGAVLVLEPDGDTRAPWKATEIDRLPTSHRVRCADIDGSGSPVFVNAPLIGRESRAPDYTDLVPLVYYRPGEWKRITIGAERDGVRHGLFITDWNGDGADEILTASFAGIHVYDRDASGRWSRTRIAKGNPAPWPKSGASDLAVGRLAGNRFLASIEPWHGEQVVVYMRAGNAWTRRVIDDALVDGHTIAAADLNGDGLDEIIAGYRGKGRSVYVYHARDKRGRQWIRTVLDDGGIAAAACSVADLNGDHRPDIACIGSATANLKWYENLGAVR